MLRNSQTIRTPEIVYSPATASTGGRVEVHPSFAARFAALGIDSPAGFLDLPGEVVSGHPDRHVLRVSLPGFPAAFYLKRQHVVSRREKWRNWVAGFGWSSRCEREAALLKQLGGAGLPCPRWAAFGTDDCGRAFLLVEEVTEATELRQVLRDPATSLADRRWLADRLGGVVALFHATGVTTPDLTAKHVLVTLQSSSPRAVADDVPSVPATLIDWQSARRVRVVSRAERLRCLAALHASVVSELATPRERLRVLWAALRPARKAGVITGQFSDLVRQVVWEAAHLTARRSIRDQRQSPVTAARQRLVWVAGEAVCAVPDVAEKWPCPPIVSPYYRDEAGTFEIRLPNRHAATLIRGRSFAPLGRLRAWLSGRSWRSPGVTLGRILFHLERYGIPAPRLLAFGQRFTGPASAEWFALHVPSAAPVPDSPAHAEQLGHRLRQLHDAGCRTSGDPLAVFGVGPGGVEIRTALAIRIVRHVSDRIRAREVKQLLAAVKPQLREAVTAGYHLGPRSGDWHDSPRSNRGGNSIVPEETECGMAAASRLTSVDGVP